MISSARHHQHNRGHRAFTLTDLIVLVAVVSILATVGLANQSSSEHVLRAQCASNLRQIGQALTAYAVRSNDYLPICGMNNQTPWYTYEAARGYSGSGVISRGFMNLGLLVRTGVMSEARPLYCPAQTLPQFTYDYYTDATNGWGLSSAGNGDDILRVGYSYYPQLRVTEPLGRGSLVLPKLTLTSMQLEFGSGTFMAPVKLSEVNPQKSITTDLVRSLSGTMSHQTQGSVAGLYALFPDGSCVFQNARANPENYDPSLWYNVGLDPIRFRSVMNGWKR